MPFPPPPPHQADVAAAATLSNAASTAASAASALCAAATTTHGTAATATSAGRVSRRRATSSAIDAIRSSLADDNARRPARDAPQAASSSFQPAIRSSRSASPLRPDELPTSLPAREPPTPQILAAVERYYKGEKPPRYTARPRAAGRETSRGGGGERRRQTRSRSPDRHHQGPRRRLVVAAPGRPPQPTRRLE